MRAINPSRIATRIFQRATVYRFCVDWAPADPRRHTTMHHSASNMYRDVWDYGQYPDWVHICSVPSRSYEPQVVEIMAQSLNQKLGSNISADFINSKRNRSWAKFLSKDLKVDRAFYEVYPSILGKLSQGIFVKESRFTWIVEQRYRFDYSIASLDMSSPLTVGDFIDRYNQDIEACVLHSNLGFAAEIDQAPSALNKHESQQHQLMTPGVQELQNLDKEHNNFINRLLAYIH